MKRRNKTTKNIITSIDEYIESIDVICMTLRKIIDDVHNTLCDRLTNPDTTHNEQRAIRQSINRIAHAQYILSNAHNAIDNVCKRARFLLRDVDALTACDDETTKNMTTTRDEMFTHFNKQLHVSRATFDQIMNDAHDMFASRFQDGEIARRIFESIMLSMINSDFVASRVDTSHAGINVLLKFAQRTFDALQHDVMFMHHNKFEIAMFERFITYSFIRDEDAHHMMCVHVDESIDDVILRVSMLFSSLYMLRYDVTQYITNDDDDTLQDRIENDISRDAMFMMFQKSVVNTIMFNLNELS